MSTRTIGTVLDGKYQILKLLGSGGMGDVYLVRHLHLKEKRVIKILRPYLAANPAALQRFQREARTATQIKHPNVATLHDFSRLPDGSFFMVWEYIEGKDVAFWLAERGPFPMRLALQLGVQVLRGLEAIHEANVVHRDISPDNLMITRDVKGRPQIKIIDLGLAKNLTESGDPEVSLEGTFLGKLRYCSPEQMALTKGAEPDRRSDLYSFALVLYEMISGLLPFDAESQHALLLRRLSTDPLPLAGRNPEIYVPTRLDQVIRRGLERHPDQRFPEAVTFIQALRSVLENLDADAAGRPRETGQQQAPMTPASPPSVRPRSDSKRLTPAERESLMAKVDAAAKKVAEGSKMIEAAGEALKQGRLEEVRALIARLESSHPGISGLTELKTSLRKSESSRRQIQVMQAEEILEQYLSQQQTSLAGLALETLLDLQPDHARSQEFRDRLDALRQEFRQRKEAERIMASGREQLAHGDLSGAIEQLERLQRASAPPDLVRRFRAELQHAEEEETKSSQLAEIRARLDERLEDEKADEAAEILEQVSEIGVAKVTLDLYRHRIQEIIDRQQREARAKELESRYRQELSDKNYQTARQIVVELRTLCPDSARPEEMTAEVSRLEEQVRRQQAVEEGTRELERLLDEGQLAQAELAWKLLAQMEAKHPQRRKLERRLKALRKKSQA